MLLMPLVQIYYLPFSSADVCPPKESTLNSLILKLTTNCKNHICVEYDGILLINLRPNFPKCKNISKSKKCHTFNSGNGQEKNL